MNRKTISTQEAKERISIVDYLSKHGFEHIGMSGNRYRYLSVFRKEKTASMFVDDSIGLFNDFGDSGGSIIDLSMKLHNFSSVEETLKHLSGFVSGSKILRNENPAQIPIFKQNSNIKNIRIRPLNHFVILRYLKEERRIEEKLAKKYLKLVWYDNQNRKGLFAMGWENNSNAWELRSAGKSNFKTVTGKKDISIIKNGVGESTSIFESMLDFLSLLMIKQIESLKGDVIILNSTSLIKRVLPYLPKKDNHIIYTFFDNDEGGQKAFLNLQKSYDFPSQIQAQTFFKDYNDVNDYWVDQ